MFKTAALGAVVPALALAIYAYNHPPTKPCPYLTSQSSDSRPQSELYRGGCLEPLTYFEIEGGLKDGRLTAQQAYASHNSSDLNIDIRPVDVEQTHNGVSLQLYEVTYQGTNLCEDEKYDPLRLEGTDTRHLKGKAIAIPGYWDGGAWHPGHGGSREKITLSCFSGVIAKCARWGYVPWVSNYKGHDLGPYHRACVQASRAMYFKSDTSFTCRNTKIEIYDDLGIQTKRDDTLAFESIWAEQGPLCLARSRWRKCDKELMRPNSPLSPGTCHDPVQALGLRWSSAASPGARIAIASSLDNEANKCPNQQGVICPDAF
jgi:hypothetical protein